MKANPSLIQSQTFHEVNANTSTTFQLCEPLMLCCSRLALAKANAKVDTDTAAHGNANARLAKANAKVDTDTAANRNANAKSLMTLQVLWSCERSMPTHCHLSYSSGL